MSTVGHLAEGDRGQARITAIKALRLESGFCLIRIDTDAGISGYGECGDLDGDLVRAALQHPRRRRRAAAAPAS
jgi:L-alanine-DL-glutamate epimerase-like enolase superfamily enzyme